MFIRKRAVKLKNGKISTNYQAVVIARRGDKKIRKAISLGEYPDPFEALDWEIKCLERMRKNVGYPTNQYLEIRHSAKYNRPMVVSVPVRVAEKRRIMWVKLFKKQKERVRVLEKLVSDLYRKRV